MIGEPLDPAAADRSVVEALTRRIVASLEGQTGRLRVAIAGESGSGKSTLAAALSHSLPAAGAPACVLHLDDYFLLPPRANSVRRQADPEWLGPCEVRLDLLDEHLAQAHQEDALVKPLVDPTADAIGSECLSLAGVSVVVVEGTYAALLEQVELKVFVAGTHQELHARREARGREPQDAALLDAVAREHDIVAPHAQLCQLVVEGAQLLER